MKVTWHAVPGRGNKADPSRRERCEGIGAWALRFRQTLQNAKSAPLTKEVSDVVNPDHTVPYGTGFDVTRVQAPRARLPSSSPFGTKSDRPVWNNIVICHF